MIVTTLMRALFATLEARVPTIVWGNPGETKTATINSLGAALGAYVHTIDGSLIEPTDFQGYPIESGGVMTYAPPKWVLDLGEHDRAILYLGELSNASLPIQKAMLRVLQERKVGEVSLPESVSIVADANPPQTAVDGYFLRPAVANRLTHLEWKFDADRWFAGVRDGFHNLPPLTMPTPPTVAQQHQNRVRVISFLENHPQWLNPGPPMTPSGQVDPVGGGGAWPSPRTWTNLVALTAWVHPTDNDVLRTLAEGTVGKEATKLFMAWAQNQNSVDPSAVLTNPNQIDWAEMPVDELFSTLDLVTTVALNNQDRASWEQALNVVVTASMHGRKDLVMPAFTRLTQSEHIKQGLPPHVSNLLGDLV